MWEEEEKLEKMENKYIWYLKFCWGTGKRWTFAWFNKNYKKTKKKKKKFKKNWGTQHFVQNSLQPECIIRDNNNNNNNNLFDYCVWVNSLKIHNIDYMFTC